MSNFIIKNLNVSFPDSAIKEKDSHVGQLKVINNFNLDIKRGEFVVILGPSGCGKSTLLSTISGLKKPDSGTIEYNHQLFYERERQINLPAEKRNIGFVFQSYALWPHMSVYQNIAFPLKVRKYARSKIRAKVEDILDLVEMRKHINSYPDQLSGGERQRVALARSLVYNPSLLLLDEPLANIDANLKETLLREIKTIHSRLNLTTMYVTHDQTEAFEIADRIVIMKDGLIMQQGTPQQIYTQSENEFVANFVGINNIVKDEDLKKLTLKEHIQTSDIATIRPEDIVVTCDGKYQGVIRELVYLGDRIKCSLEFNSIPLITYLEQDSELKRGDVFNFDIRHYHFI